MSVLPKLFFVFLWLASSFYLLRLGKLQLQDGLHQGELLFILLMTLLSPFFWGRVVIQGLHDIFLGALLLIGLWFFRRKSERLSGFFIGLGFLFKFVPIFIIPILGFHGLYPRWRLIWSFFVTIIAGFVISFFFWGKSCFLPLIYGASRDATWDSIFRFLNGAYSPLQWITTNPNTVYLSTPLLILSVLVIFLWTIIRRVDPLPAALLTLVSVYTQQFPLVTCESSATRGVDSSVSSSTIPLPVFS